MTNLQMLFSFNGRIRRLHWWMGSLILIGMTLFVLVVGGTMIGMFSRGDGATSPGANFAIGGVLLAGYVGLIWGQLALGVKRLHDRGNSGWWMLIGFVPLAAIALLVMLGFLDGTQGPNKYGASPKGIGGATGDRELGNVFS